MIESCITKVAGREPAILIKQDSPLGVSIYIFQKNLEQNFYREAGGFTNYFHYEKVVCVWGFSGTYFSRSPNVGKNRPEKLLIRTFFLH